MKQKNNDAPDAKEQLLQCGWNTEEVGEKMRAFKGSDLTPHVSTGWFETWDEVLNAAIPRLFIFVNEANGVVVKADIPLRIEVCYDTGLNDPAEWEAFKRESAELQVQFGLESIWP